MRWTNPCTLPSSTHPPPTPLAHDKPTPKTSPPPNNLQFLMSANGSLPAPGKNLTAVSWRVTSRPDDRLVVSVTGFGGLISLPTGSYTVTAAAYDSGGGNATASKQFCIGGVPTGYLTATSAGSGSSSSSTPTTASSQQPRLLNQSALAVISLPPPWLQQAPGSGLTRVQLDSLGSAAAAGAAAVNFLWAVVKLPARTAAANASGATAEVWLGPGSYQVGMLISDSKSNTATIKKSFTIGPPPSSSPSTPGSGSTPPPPPASSSTYGSPTTRSPPPALPLPAVQLAAPSIYGGKLAAPSSPRMPAARLLYQGTVLEIDAATTGLFNLSNSGWRADAAAAACTWTLTPSSSSTKPQPPAAAAAVTTVYGCADPARFRLGAVGSYILTLKATLKGRAVAASASSQITVAAKPKWGGYYTPSSIQGFPAGRCTPPLTSGDSSGSSSGSSMSGGFSGVEFQPLSLACSGVTLPLGWGADLGLDKAAQALSFSWRLTALTARAAAAHLQPLVGSAAGGARAAFGAVAAGLYLVDMAAGAAAAGGGSSSSSSGSSSAGTFATSSAQPNAVYVMSSILVVGPSNRLSLLPATQQPSCAGASLTLSPAPLALLPAQIASPASWAVTWLDATAATGRPLTLTGSGSSFGFVPQPGRYNATVTIDVREGSGSTAATRRLGGWMAIGAQPCVTCTAAAVTLDTSQSACAPAAADAVRLLALRPPWLGAGGTVDFAAGADLSPGAARSVGLIARSSARTGALTAACAAAKVTVRDATAPTAALVKAQGECLSPADGRWACLPPSSLVRASDACGGLRPVRLKAACGVGASTSSCKVAADGRVCLRAETIAATTTSRAVEVAVQVADGFGNSLPAPVKVPVTVFRDTRMGCIKPDLSNTPY
jgi:hypothetical protein